jgi:hypothetical protein
MRSVVSLLLLVALLPACGLGAEMADHAPDRSEPSPAALRTPDPAAALPSPLCPDPNPIPVTDLDVRAPPRLPEPAPRTPYRDPVFGTCAVRVTDRQRDLDAEDPSRGIANEYARVQSFNADESLILARSIEAYWYVYDARSLQPLGKLPLGNEPRWDAADPNRIYYTEDTRLMAYDLQRGESELIHEFALDVPGQSLAAVWTRYEGRPSMDTRYWGLMAEDEAWLPVAFLVYDRAKDRVTARDVRGLPGTEDDVDHVTISPLGDTFLASFDRACAEGRLGSDGAPCGLMAYDRDLRDGRGLLRVAGHYDVALDAGGREVVVYQDIDTDQIAIVDLETGDVTPLWAIDFSHTPLGLHFSGLSYGRPGWAVVSTHSGGYPGAYTWMDDQVFLVELRAGGGVIRLAHTHSRVDEDVEHDYWAEPHATTNRDLTRVLFTSNWGRSGTEEVEMYLIELPWGDWSGLLR